MINLTLQEWQYIMNMLMKCPYGEVHELVAKIVSQHEAATAKPSADVIDMPNRAS